jgi:hypothetical protein
MATKPAFQTKDWRMYKDQNGQKVSAGNGRRYAFGLGSQKQPVRLRYDVEADELVVAFGRSNEWARASEFSDFTFSEIDSEGVEIPVADPAVLLPKRLQDLENEAFSLRVRQGGLIERVRKTVLEFRELNPTDEQIIMKFVFDGVGSVEQLAEHFTKQAN